ncbi:MAG: DUF4954 family protein [Muribaculaceae bacterium]|nr:DUF4954 family protein [Muribaculaceae bacterium]
MKTPQKICEMEREETEFRKLSEKEIALLEKNGNRAVNWADILIEPDLDLTNIVNVRFKGAVAICSGVVLRDIPGGLGGLTIRRGSRIENVASVEFEPESMHGVGVMVAVLDETGSRNVPIYPGLSSQMATLMARDPKWLECRLNPTIRDFIDSRATPAEIGEGAVIINSGPLKNVSVGREVVIDGAARLTNGSVINNASPGKCFTRIGSGVEAADFILEDARLESKAAIFKCYVGQGVEISHGFSAQESLFFANSTMENGESHALLAGPYTVSMHKGTLLIGCQTSFMNAGSTTNQSNHMYKLGPVHWGLLERGVKTASGSYLMLGAKIGAFSLLMGSHKTHPDSSEFPFSYLFGDERGATVVVPAVMLRSCGLLRDEMKWPNRDRRLKRKLPLYDKITFDVLNPFTVDTMLKAIHTIEDLLTRPADDDLFMRYKGMKFTRAALERAKNLYNLAIFKYMSVVLEDENIPEGDGENPDEWLDLGGLIMPRRYLDRIREAEGIAEAEEICAEAYARYDELQKEWVARRFDEWWRQHETHIKVNAEKFDEMVEEDRHQYLQMLARETEMLAL